MPNHITNEIKAAQYVLDALKGTGSLIDFNSVIPRPDCFVDEPSGMIVDLAKLVMGVEPLGKLQAAAQAAGNPGDAFSRGDFKSASAAVHFSNVMRLLTNGPFLKDGGDKELNEFFNACRAIKQTGYAYWFDWCCDNWGTKWNAHDIKQIDAQTIRFNTAWCPPLPVLDALAEQFPTEPIRFRWASKDFGNCAGEMLIVGNDITGGSLPDDTRESHALAAELVWDGEVPDEYLMMPDGRYVYTDE